MRCENCLPQNFTRFVYHTLYLTTVLDLDMSACHHRIAYMKGLLYGVEDLEPLAKYVKDPKAWRKRIKDETECTIKDAKAVGMILLNTGGLQCWMEAAESTPIVSDELHIELEKFRDCATRIRDVALVREQHIFPPALRKANPRRRWSFSMAAVEDKALRAIWKEVEALGAKVIMPVYDGLMLLPREANKVELAAAATEAATKACGCPMPTRFKPMEIEGCLKVILRYEERIQTLESNKKCR